jgi:RNA polymerase sigma-70 factor (ECF subfamily)
MGTSLKSELEQAMPRAYLAALRWLRNPDESREAIQEAAAKVLATADRYDSSQPFYPWFYRILKNHCIDRIKQRERSSEALQALRDEKERQTTGANAEHLVLNEERSRALVDAVNALPDELREVIELRHFRDLTYEEIAEIIARPVGTVMSRLYRARQALRKRLRRSSEFFREHDFPRSTA